MTDPYSVLGVPKDATDEVIKSAYRKLAMQHHPDKPDGDAEKFKEIASAYSAIETKAKRDALLREQSQTNFWSNGPTPDEHDFGATIDAILRRQHQAHRQRMRNPDYYHRVVLSLDQALAGCDIEFEMTVNNENKTLKLKVPPGVRQGTRMRLPGHGHAGNSDIPPGDLYVDILIDVEGFMQAGIDLHTNCEVDALSLMVNRRAELTGPGGQRLNFSVPPGAGTGQRIRLGGHGLPNGAGGRGDLIVTLLVTVPVLNDEQIALAQQILDLRSQ